MTMALRELSWDELRSPRLGAGKEDLQMSAVGAVQPRSQNCSLRAKRSRRGLAPWGMALAFIAEA